MKITFTTAQLKEILTDHLFEEFGITAHSKNIKFINEMRLNDKQVSAEIEIKSKGE